jgi:hypothetical protein
MGDAKELLRQELALAKHEIGEEVSKTKLALIALGVGIATATIGGLLLIFMLVHMLNAFTGLPLWASYGIIGGILNVIGMVMVWRGKNTMSHIGIVPYETVETMKENMRWIKRNAISNKTYKKREQQ